MTYKATVDFSAEFGGRDAADRALPHFKALKRAAKTILISDFPYPELVYILRVDGEVSQFGFSGIDNFDFDKSGEYLSLDIVINMQDQEMFVEFISSTLRNSTNRIIEEMKCRKINSCNSDNMNYNVNKMIKNYMKELPLELK